MKTKKKKLSHQAESWFHLGKGHFPLSFSSSTYFAKTSLHRPRRESSANSDTLPSKNKENFLMSMSRWHKCQTKTMNKPQESVIIGSSGNLRHQCPIHHSQLSESGTHCVNWWWHFFVEKQNWTSMLFLRPSLGQSRFGEVQTRKCSKKLYRFYRHAALLPVYHWQKKTATAFQSRTWQTLHAREIRLHLFLYK